MNNILKYTSIVASLALSLSFASVAFAGTTVGNEAKYRTYLDGGSNTTIIDTNSPVNQTGTLGVFNYYASNLNTFQFIVVDQNNVQKWVSPTITPVAVGINSWFAPVPVPVEAGWNLGAHFNSAGTIPFDVGNNGKRVYSLDAVSPTVGTPPISTPLSTVVQTDIRDVYGFSPWMVIVGTPAYETAKVSASGSGAVPTGNVLFISYENGNCTGAPSLVETVPLVNGQAVSSSRAVTNLSRSYITSYLGDLGFQASSGSCDFVLGYPGVSN